MRRARNASRRYRGTSRRGIGIIIPVLVALCVIAAAALYFINDNMIFTLDGAFFSVDSKEKGSASEVQANLVIEEPEPEPEPELLSPADEVATPQESGGVRAYFVPIGSVKNEELFNAVLSGLSPSDNINTLVLEAKATDGTLAFAVSSPIAENAAVEGDDETLRTVISKARESGYKVALYMSCFMDNEAARKNQEYSVRTENKIIWIDGTNTRWLSAYSDAAQEYLLLSVEKLASFSPDEIILSNISFPAIGKTEIVYYDKALGAKRDVLKSFIEKAEERAGGVLLSAVYENYNESLISESGQDVRDFDVFKTLYIPATAERYTNGINTVADKFEKAKLVPITKDTAQEEFLIKK